MSLLDVVDGLLLGDGSVDRKGSLRIEQCATHLPWFDSIEQQLLLAGYSSKRTIVHPRIRHIEGREVRSKGGAVLYTSCVFKDQRQRWYPKGVKCVPEDVALTPLSLAYWFCGDGTYDKQGALFFCTNGFLKKEVERLAKELTAQGVTARCKPLSRSQEWQVAVTQRDAALRFKDIVESYLPPCFGYKLEHVRAAIPRGSTQAKVTRAQAEEIRERAPKEGQKVLAAEFSVTQAAISRIVRGEVHK